MGRIKFYPSNADRQKAYRERLKMKTQIVRRWRRVPCDDPLRLEALNRFRQDSSKCFQRHIREVTAEHDPRPSLANLKNAVVAQVSNRLAAQIILRFEWLGTMPGTTTFSYGLWPDAALHHKQEDLLGAVVFTKGGNVKALASVGPYDSTMILARGACVMRAGRNAASFLISRACKLAARDHGVTHFLAYSDPEAGERGVIYRALNWKCLGPTGGKRSGKHLGFESPENQKMSSYLFSRKFNPRFFHMGWDGKQPKYEFLVSLGWKPIKEPAKLRWLHIEQKFFDTIPLKSSRGAPHEVRIDPGGQI